MPTSYATRTIPTTTYNLTRLWGEYLLDWNGEQILDWNGNPIVTIVPWGHLSITAYNTRVQPLLYFYLEVSDWVNLQIDDTDDLEIIDPEVGFTYTKRIIP